MKVPITDKTINILKEVSTSFVNAGIIPKDELNNLWSLAQRSQEVGTAPPLILVSRAKAAKILNISARSLDRLIKQEKLPCVRVGKRAIRLDPRKIEQFVDEHSGMGAL